MTTNCINHLPNEILQMIFHLCCDDILGSFPRTNKHSRRRKKFSCVASLVCKKWFQIIEDTPSLWETTVTFIGLDHFLEKGSELLKAYERELVQSRGSDLNIVVRVNPLHDILPVPPSEEHQLFLQTIAMLCRYSRQWKRVFVAVVGELLDILFRILGTEDIWKRLSRLTCLIFHCQRTDESPYNIPQQVSDRMSSLSTLQSLSFRGVNISNAFKFPPYLQDVTMVVPHSTSSTGEFFDTSLVPLFSQATTWKTLSVRNSLHSFGSINPDGEWPWSQKNPLVMCAMKMELEFPYAILVDIISKSSCPSLHTLNLCAPDDRVVSELLLPPQSPATEYPSLGQLQLQMTLSRARHLLFHMNSPSLVSLKVYIMSPRDLVSPDFTWSNTSFSFPALRFLKLHDVLPFQDVAFLSGFTTSHITSLDITYDHLIILHNNEELVKNPPQSHLGLDKVISMPALQRVVFRSIVYKDFTNLMAHLDAPILNEFHFDESYQLTLEAFPLVLL